MKKKKKIYLVWFVHKDLLKTYLSYGSERGGARRPRGDRTLPWAHTATLGLGPPHDTGLAWSSTA